MIEERFERAFKAALDLRGQDLFEQVRRVEDEVARDGLVYRNKAFPLLPRITVLSAEQRDELADASERLLDLLEKVIRIFEADDETRRYFLLKDRWEELVAIEPGYRRAIRVSRFDTYLTGGPERFKVLENNTDCPAGVIFTGRVNSVLKRVPAFGAFLAALPPVRAEGIDGPDAFFHELLSAYQESGGGRPSGVAVLQVRGRESAESREMIGILARRGLPAVLCDPRDMRYAGGKLTAGGVAVDLVWNKINTADFVPLLEGSDPPEDYIQACRERSVCQVNSFKARFITESKLCLAYLSDPAFHHQWSPAERALIDRHIPWSRRLSGDPEVELRGHRSRLRDLAAARREDLVLKAAYDIRGDGVTVGRAVTQQEWRSLLDSAWDRPFILQEFIPPQRIDVPCSDAPLTYQAKNFSVDLFMLGGRFAGFGSKLSSEWKVNVFQGGSKQALLSVVDPRVASGRLVHVFTSGHEGGNPAVVVRGEGRDGEAMQELARRFDAPTVYTLPSSRADVRVRVFSPRAEIGFCGHGILAGAHAYARDSGMSRFTVETQGRTVSVEATDGMLELWVGEAARVSRAPSEPAEILDMLGLGAADLEPDLPFCVASIGSPKLLVPVATLRALLSARPRLDAISAWSKAHAVSGVYAYCLETVDPSADVHARAFNPLFGVDEDAATGVAAGALAAVLTAGRGLPVSLRIEQGHAIGRKSEILVRADERGIRLGGRVTPAGAVRSTAGG